jgi:predicted PurR-regulated permease PerM
VVTLTAALIIAATVFLIVLAFVPYIQQVIGDIASGLETLKTDLEQAQLPPDLASAAQDAADGLESWVSGTLGAVVGAVGQAATVAILSFFLTFFLLMDGDKGWAWALQAAGGLRREEITISGRDAIERVGGYLRGTAILSAARAIAVLIYLVVAGVPLAAPLAVLVFMCGFIPYVGGIVSSLVVALVAYGSNGLQTALVLLLLIAITNFLLGKLLGPAIYGRAVKIHPALVLLALPIGAALAGVVGLFVAIPVAAFVLAVSGAVVAVLEPEPAADRDPSSFIPGWLDNLAQRSWRLLIAVALLVVVVQLAVQLPAVVLSLVLGLVLAATFAPLVRMLRVRGWGATGAALVVTTGAVALIAAILGITLVSLLRQAEQLASATATGAQTANDATGGALDALEAVVGDFSGGIVQGAASVLAEISGLAVVVVLATLLCFYFLREGGSFWSHATRRMSEWRRRQVDEAGQKAFSVLGGYMIGTGAISAFGAATQFVIMVLLGIPLALPLAVLSFFGGFIPYIGSLLTTGFAFLVTVAFGSTQDIVIMGIFTLVFNIVQGNIVAPLVYGRAVNLHPAVVLLAIPAGGAVAGIIGMFLVVPFLGVVAAVWRAVLSVFGDEPEAAPPGAPSGAADALPGASDAASGPQAGPAQPAAADAGTA